MKKHFFQHQTIAILLLFIAAPVVLFNLAISLATSRQAVEQKVREDIYGFKWTLIKFKRGVFKKILYLVPVAQGQLLFVGAPMVRSSYHNYARLPVGLYSEHHLDQYSGLYDSPLEQSLEKCRLSLTCALNTIIRTHIAKMGFKKNLAPVDSFELFGIRVGNHTMQSALEWATTKRRGCQTGVFVNVNSVNLAWKNQPLTESINRADIVMADGSGVRLAAQKLGIQLRQNVNGTDMLPLLCESLIQKNMSVFLYGASAEIIEKTYQTLRLRYPNLKIVGYQDGYEKDHDKIVAKINASGADVLLVGMGSPLQEAWLEDHRSQLKTSTALAVGGLFDFVAGKFPRAPRWVRQLGMEWIVRLVHEPKNKFRRYVLGNPLFMVRLTTSPKQPLLGIYKKSLN